MRTRFIKGQKGFSLVEVMIALAVIAVGLIAIVGLIPQGIQSSRSAADNTLVATIVHDVFDAVRSQPFANVDLSNRFALGFVPLTYDLTLPSSQSGTAYFDASGFSTTATSADRYYVITLNFQSVNTGLSLITATVSWPAKSATPINSSAFVTQIANYQ